MPDGLDAARDKLRRYREADDGAIAFVREQFKVEPDGWQADALRRYQTGKQRLAMRACKNPGKTATLSWIAWHFLTCFPHPNIAATSITGENLRDGLWKEMAKWQIRSPLLQDQFTWTAERIFLKAHPATWWMSARKWSKASDATQQANTLAGLHADYVMFLLDETGAMPRAVMAAAEAALGSGIRSKLVQAGNPTNLEGPLYDACVTERHLWELIEITGDPDDPKRAPRVDVQWARDQIAKYGADSPWVLVNVFGKFPPSSLNSLLGPDEVQAAMARHLRSDQYDWAQKRLGVDVARFGDDRSVIFPRQGLASFKPVVMQGARTTDIAARVALAKQKWGSEVEFIDDTGHWGHGVIDNLVAAGHSPVGIQFHGQAIDPRYRNKRAEMWIGMAEWVKSGGALPPIAELVAELCTPTYTFLNGKFLLEDKDQIKERLGRSPDLADALALTFALPEMPAQIAALARGNHARTEFDPYSDADERQAKVEFDPYRDSI